jgi:hypothetical protein
MQPSDPSDTTRTQPLTELLLALRDGRAGVVDRLYPLVYEELRRIAHRALRGERTGHTLGTTGLVHEAYLGLVDQTRWSAATAPTSTASPPNAAGTSVPSLWTRPSWPSRIERRHCWHSTRR